MSLTVKERQIEKALAVIFIDSVVVNIYCLCQWDKENKS